MKKPAACSPTITAASNAALRHSAGVNAARSVPSGTPARPYSDQALMQPSCINNATGSHQGSSASSASTHARAKSSASGSSAPIQSVGTRRRRARRGVPPAATRRGAQLRVRGRAAASRPQSEHDVGPLAAQIAVQHQPGGEALRVRARRTARPRPPPAAPRPRTTRRQRRRRRRARAAARASARTGRAPSQAAVVADQPQRRADRDEQQRRRHPRLAALDEAAPDASAGAAYGAAMSSARPSLSASTSTFWVARRGSSAPQQTAARPWRRRRDSAATPADDRAGARRAPARSPTTPSVACSASDERPLRRAPSASRPTPRARRPQLVVEPARRRAARRRCRGRGPRSGRGRRRWRLSSVTGSGAIMACPDRVRRRVPADPVFAGLAARPRRSRCGSCRRASSTETCLGASSGSTRRSTPSAIVFAERAPIEADQADGRRRGGDTRPLLGVPVAIKDDTDVAGEITARGTNAFGEPARAGRRGRAAPAQRPVR